jgi:hypothetical protein
VSGDLPSHSLGSSHGLNYRSIAYSPWSYPDIDLFSNCKGSTAVVGGGVGLTGPSRKSHVAYGFPGDDTSDGDLVADDVWKGAGVQRGNPRALKITTYSICLTQGVGPVNYASSPAGTVAVGDAFSEKATCPKGTAVAAGGSDVYRGTVSTSSPFDGSDAGRAPDDGWKVTGVNSETSPTDLTVWAVCLNTSHKLSYVAAHGTTPGKDSKSIKASCPDGAAATGGGYTIKGAPDTRFAHVSRPRDSDADKDKVPDDRWQVSAVNLSDQSAKTTVIVACLH